MDWHYRHANLLEIPTEIPGLVVLENGCALLEEVSPTWLAACPRLERSDGRAWFVVAKILPRDWRDHSHTWCHVIYIDETLISGLLWRDLNGLEEPNAAWSYPRQGWNGMFGFRKLPPHPALMPQPTEHKWPRLSPLAFSKIVAAVRGAWASWPKFGSQLVRVGSVSEKEGGVSYTPPHELTGYGEAVFPRAFLEMVAREVPGAFDHPRRFTPAEVAASRITRASWLIEAVEQGRLATSVN